MSVTTFTALRLIKNSDGFKDALLMTGDNHLSDTLTVMDREWLMGEIDQEDFHLPTIVSINGPRSIQHGDAMLQSQAGAWPYLCLIAFRQSNMQSCGDELSLQGLEDYRCLEIGTKIHAGTLRCGILGEGLVARIDNFYLNHNAKIRLFKHITIFFS